MSQYHKHCTSSTTPRKQLSKTKQPRGDHPKVNKTEDKSLSITDLLTFKPFCDCRRCTCQECPDILKMLSITVSKTSCHFGSKVKSKDDIPKPSGPETSRILEVVNPDRNCSCGVVARGIRDHIHMNIGMSGRRDNIKAELGADSRKNVTLADDSSSIPKQ